MEPDFVVSLTTVPVDVKRKEKNEHVRIIVWENGKY